MSRYSTMNQGNKSTDRKSNDEKQTYSQYFVFILIFLYNTKIE